MLPCNAVVSNVSTDWATNCDFDSFGTVRPHGFLGHGKIMVVARNVNNANVY